METSTFEVNGLVIPLTQMREAEDWTRDAAGIANDVFVSYNRSYRYVVKNYPGGWSAFVEECCTFVQL